MSKKPNLNLKSARHLVRIRSAVRRVSAEAVRLAEEIAELAEPAMIPILVAAIAVGCADSRPRSGGPAGTATPAALQDKAVHDKLTPSQHAEGVTGTCEGPYVPDEATAVRIAEAVWLAFYGKEIYNSRPFRAELAQGVWIVSGSLPEGWQGGVPIARINRDDGRILQVIHTQ